MKKAIPVLIAIVLILIIGGVPFGPQIIEKYSFLLYNHYIVN